MRRARAAPVARALACALLALTALAPSAGVAASARAQRRELDRAEAMLRKSLAPHPGTPADPAVRLARQDQQLKLVFPVSFAFEPDSESLRPAAIESLPLAATIRLLTHRHAWSAQLRVYTDTIGGASANQSLSAARASALDQALIAAGVNSDRLAAYGAGATDPEGSNDTPEGRIQNRRVEIMFERAATAARSPATQIRQ